MHQMRRSDRAMTESEAWEFLKQQEVGRLGIIADSEPYVVPLNYVVLGESIYFHSAREGLKMEAIQRNPRVCFLVDQFIGIKHGAGACDFSAYYRSVMARGRAQLLQDIEEITGILNALTLKYARGQEFEPASSNGLMPTAVVQIHVEHISGKQLLPQ